MHNALQHHAFASSKKLKDTNTRAVSLVELTAGGLFPGSTVFTFSVIVPAMFTVCTPAAVHVPRSSSEKVTVFTVAADAAVFSALIPGLDNLLWPEFSGRQPPIFSS